MSWLEHHREGSKDETIAVFDLDEITEVSALTTADAKSVSTKKSSGRARPLKNAPDAESGAPNSAQTIDLTEEGLVKSAAAKAIATANMLTQKFPAKGKSAYKGAYDTIEDKYGNRIPVVALDGRWVVLTEKSLIQSRRKVTPRNFGMSVAASLAMKGKKKDQVALKQTGSKQEKKCWGDEDSSNDEYIK
jgi:hypothetical protein